MIKDIISSIDYDIYKSLFISPEDQEFADEQIQTMIGIVKKHL